MVGDGTVKAGAPGDYRIMTPANQLVDIVAAAKLIEHYELLQDTLPLSRETCRHLEDQLGLGVTASEAALLTAVTRVASITLGGVALEFTPGQMEELAHRAGKRGRTLAQEIQVAVDAFKDQLFYGGVGVPVR